jgi:hypothetical protein
MDNFEGLLLAGGLGGSGFSLAFDWKSEISGRVSNGGTGITDDFARDAARSLGSGSGSVRTSDCDTDVASDGAAS